MSCASLRRLVGTSTTFFSYSLVRKLRPFLSSSNYSRDYLFFQHLLMFIIISILSAISSIFIIDVFAFFLESNP